MPQLATARLTLGTALLAAVGAARGGGSWAEAAPTGVAAAGAAAPPPAVTWDSVPGCVGNPLDDTSVYDRSNGRLVGVAGGQQLCLQAKLPAAAAADQLGGSRPRCTMTRNVNNIVIDSTGRPWVRFSSHLLCDIRV